MYLVSIPVLNNGVYFGEPKTTGVQKCDYCGGWISENISYIVDEKRYCSNCFEKINRNKNKTLRIN